MAEEKVEVEEEGKLKAIRYETESCSHGRGEGVVTRLQTSTRAVHTQEVRERERERKVGDFLIYCAHLGFSTSTRNFAQLFNCVEIKRSHAQSDECGSSFLNVYAEMSNEVAFALVFDTEQ